MTPQVDPRRRRVLAGAAALACLPASRTRAQPLKRVGVLTPLPRDHPAAAPYWRISAEVLKARGSEEGRKSLSTVHVVTTRDEGEAAARQLVADRADLIAADHDGAVLAAMQATTTIPIVAIAGQAAELGLAQTLARPSGNVPGVVFQSHEENGRVLSLLREFRTGLARVGIPLLPTSRVWAAWFDSFVEAARAAAIAIIALPPPSSPDQIAPMLEAAKAERIQALVMPILPFLGPAVWQPITAWAVEQRVVTRGPLLSRGEAVVAMGANVAELVRLQNEQIDRVLRGADPAMTPFLQPTRWDTVINQRLARAVGWAAPPAVLVQATEVIE